ncbi:MAG: hypothetical protein ABSE49_31140 [Polyangiaceae bacterium]|jgi:hypothetical protein
MMLPIGRLPEDTLLHELGVLAERLAVAEDRGDEARAEALRAETRALLGRLDDLRRRQEP